MASQAKDLARVLQGAGIVLRHALREQVPRGVDAVKAASVHAADAARQAGGITPQAAATLANSAANVATSAFGAMRIAGPGGEGQNAPDFAGNAGAAAPLFAAQGGAADFADAVAPHSTPGDSADGPGRRADAALPGPPPPAGAGEDVLRVAAEQLRDPKDAELASSFVKDRDLRMRQSRERAVPSSQVGRVFGFGSLAAGLAFGTVSEVAKRALGGGGDGGGGGGGGGAKGGGAGGKAPKSNPVITEANAERLAEALCRMRGAALKLGQMLSIQDESVIPPPLLRVLERVRANADVMPSRQVNAMLAGELGSDWRALVQEFSETPMAAASIGQVHRAVLHGDPEALRRGLGDERWSALLAEHGEDWVDDLAGCEVALKIQYPGVAESIDSDLANLTRLVSYSNLMPSGLYVDEIVRVAKAELALECDYRREAWCTRRYRELVADDACFAVPRVVPYLTSSRVIATEMMEGVPIDVVSKMSQQTRNRVARRMLRLTIRELFEWRFMQTDPNWGNFLYDPSRDLIGLLDFGATREFGEDFVDEYMNVVWAAANGDRATIVDVRPAARARPSPAPPTPARSQSSIKLGFLTGDESKKMVEAHVDAGLAVGAPFMSEGAYDFSKSTITAQVGQQGETFLHDRLTPPPQEAYSLHRKLSGAFLMCMKLGATIHCRDILEQARDEVLHRRSLRSASA